MQHVVDTTADGLTRRQIADITFHKVKPSPLFRRHQLSNLLQIMAMPGSKTIQTYYLLIKPQQGFKQIGTDKTGNAGNQP